VSALSVAAVLWLPGESTLQSATRAPA